jgi:hypothetical protein
MLRKLLIWLSLFALLLGAVSIAVAAAPPSQAPTEVPQGSLAPSAAAPIGIQNIGTSTLANVTPAGLPIGTAFDLCFTVFIQSPDQEYLDRFDVDLPDGWTINWIAGNSNPLANGCSGALPPVPGVDAGPAVAPGTVEAPAPTLTFAPTSRSPTQAARPGHCPGTMSATAMPPSPTRSRAAMAPSSRRSC